MTPRLCRPGWSAVMGIALMSCVNVSHISDFSLASAVMLGKYDGISFSASEYCHEFICLDPQAYITGSISFQKTCDCSDFILADKSMTAINTVLSAYFTGLNNLSKTYSAKAPFVGVAGAIKDLSASANLGINDDEIKATKDLATLVSGYAVDLYRRKELRKIVTRANVSVLGVIAAQQRNIQYLRNILGAESREITSALTSLATKAKEPGLVWLLNKELIQQTAMLHAQDHLLALFSEGLEKIKSGHEQLFQNRNSIKDPDFRKAILKQAEAIRILLEDFKAVKNQ